MKFSVNYKRLFALVAIVFLSVFSSLPAAEGDVLLDDSFTIANRQKADNLPGSTSWFTSSQSRKNTLTIDNGELYWVTDQFSAFVIGYFTAADAPRKLAVGESIALTVQFTVQNAKSQNYSFRVALLNSGSSRIDKDGGGFDGGGILYSMYSGYGVMMDLGADSPNPLQIAKRNSSGAALQLMTDGALGPLGKDKADSPRPASGTAQTLVLTVTRAEETRVSITAAMNGVSMTVLDNSGHPATAFDTVAIFQGGQAESLKFTRISVKVQKGAANTTSLPVASATVAQRD